MGVQKYYKKGDNTNMEMATENLDKKSEERKGPGQDQVFGSVGQMEPCVKSRKNVLSNWKYIIENIDPITLLEELDKENIIEQKNFADITRKKRSHQASLVLIAACNKIDNEHDFLKFQEILRSISIPCADRINQIVEHDPLPPVDEITKNNVATAIQQNRREFEDKLQSSEFLDIVNDFVEASIFDLSHLEKLVCSYPQREAATNFVDIILSNVPKGSIACLIRSLNDNRRSRKFRSLLTTIDSPSKRDKQDLHQVKLEEGILFKNTPSGGVEASVTISVRDGNDTFPQQLKDSPQRLVVEFAKAINVCVAEIKPGSIVLVLKYLDSKIIEQIKTKIKNGSLTQCLDALVKDKSMQEKLSAGKMTIEVKIQLSTNTDSQSHSQHRSYPANIIKLNRNFLIEEIDTLSLLKLFKRKKHPKCKYLESLTDRKLRAEEIVDLLESEDISDVLKLLKEADMHFVLDRLQKCKQSYLSSIPFLRQRILRNLQYIASKLDYEVIKATFVEREVFKSDLFDSLDNTFVDDKDKTIAILIEALNTNLFAVKTLIDVMFICGFDNMAAKIIQDTLDVTADTMEDATEAKLKVTLGTSGENYVLFKGVYTVDIRQSCEVQLTSEQLQRKIRNKWGSLRLAMEPSCLSQKLVDINFLSPDELKHLGDYSRSIQTHRLLITMNRKLQNEVDVKVLMNALQDPQLMQFADILTSSTSQQLVLKTDEIQRHQDILEIHRSILQNNLSQRDILIIIDKFIEMSIFDLDTLELVINDPITYTAERFMNNVISHTEHGACQCLYDSLKHETFCYRHVHFINAMNASDKLLFCTSGETSVISANRVFLIEEVDPATIMSEFEKRGNFSFHELLRDRSVNRKELAEQFVTILEREAVLELQFLEILETKQMHFILNRLKRYRDAYEHYTDISKLRRHIANSILSLVEYLNIDDIRQIYIERKIASREMFKDIERTYAGRTDQLIAVIITTLNSGANAMFTLLGILNGVQGSVGFFNTISDTSSEQSTNQHDVSRETSISNEDSAFGSRETSGKETDSLRASKSPPTKHSFLTRKGKETDSLRAFKCPPTKQSFLISKDRKLQKGKEQMTSQKADNRASHLLESSCKKIKPKACSAPRKNDHMISRKTDSDSSYSMESISNPTKFKDRPLFKRKEHGIASNIKGSRIPVLTNVKENPKEDSTKTDKKDRV